MNFVEPIRDKKKLEAIKKYLKGKNLRDYLMFMVGISSALRISDILKLTIDDVWTGKAPRDYIKLHEQKTTKRKAFPITPNLKRAIKDYISSLDEYSQDDYLFQSRKGNQAITRQHASLVLSEAAKAVGLEDISTHSMRKTWGYWAYKSGVDLGYIMEALNHSSIANTKRYLGITQDDLDQIYINLNL